MDALLVIDVQIGMFANPAAQPYDGERVVERIAGLICAARAAQTPVIYVQHDGGTGDVLARDAPGFAFRPEVAPARDEPVFVKKFCSAFQGTELMAFLESRNINRIAVCGMQTEYCVDTTCRSAFERGFAVTLISDAHTTFDSDAMPVVAIIRHHNATLSSGGFVVVREAAAVQFGNVTDHR